MGTIEACIYCNGYTGSGGFVHDINCPSLKPGFSHPTKGITFMVNTPPDISDVLQTLKKTNELLERLCLDVESIKHRVR